MITLFLDRLLAHHYSDADNFLGGRYPIYRAAAYPGVSSPCGIPYESRQNIVEQIAEETSSFFNPGQPISKRLKKNASFGPVTATDKRTTLQSNNGNL